MAEKSYSKNASIYFQTRIFIAELYCNAAVTGFPHG